MPIGGCPAIPRYIWNCLLFVCLNLTRDNKAKLPGAGGRRNSLQRKTWKSVSQPFGALALPLRGQTAGLVGRTTGFFFALQDEEAETSVPGNNGYFQASIVPYIWGRVKMGEPPKGVLQFSQGPASLL